MPEASIVIPNYNGAELLPECLGSVLAAADACPVPCEVVVVDDGSSDDSVALLESRFATVRLVRHSRNRGFSEAVRTGIEAARAERVILLNSDVKPEVDFAAPLLRWFEHADVFSVSPLIYAEGSDVPHKLTLNRPRLRGGELRRGRWTLEEIRDRVASGGTVETLFVSGGSMALRRSMFLELDGFLDLYKPFYGEDQDLGVRAWRRGWRSVVEPDSSIVHKKSGTIRKVFALRYVKLIQQRNQFLFLWLHLSSRDIWLRHVPRVLLSLPLRLLRFDRQYLGGLSRALSRLPAVVRERRRLRMQGGASLESVLEKLRQTGD